MSGNVEVQVGTVDEEMHLDGVGLNGQLECLSPYVFRHVVLVLMLTLFVALNIFGRPPVRLGTIVSI
jgi:hypothetical protein